MYPLHVPVKRALGRIPAWLAFLQDSALALGLVAVQEMIAAAHATSPMWKLNNPWRTTGTPASVHSNKPRLN